MNDMTTRLKLTGKAGMFVAACVSLVVCASCSGQEESDTGSVLSDTEISLSLSEWTPMMQSRATTLFDDGDTGNLLDEEKGGGNFTVYAQVDATKQVYMNGVRTWYFKDAGKWYILDGNGNQATYYWTESPLNFFAYMPYDNKSNADMKAKTHVAVNGYSATGGWQFTCNLPATVSESTEMQEFIYAYETNKTKKDNPVLLHFKHPFALINFKVKSGSYRMTVNDIQFSPIYLNGTFSVENGVWTSTDARQTYTAEIGKRIPNEVNYNTLLSDWLIVMPQDLSGVSLTLSASRDGAENISKTITFESGKEWKPGYQYTYVISCGDNNEEIYFNVEVEEWKIIKYEQDIDVE